MTLPLVVSLFACATLATTSVKVFLQNHDGSLAYTLENSSAVYYTPATKSAKPVCVYNTVITEKVLKEVIKSYEDDDVWTLDFLGGIQLISTTQSAVLDVSGISYLHSLSKSNVMIDSMISCPTHNMSNISTFLKSAITPPGPYLAKITSGTISLLKTYATFYDQYDGFMNGVTANDDGSFAYARLWHPEQFEKIIPYPSRLYTSLLDPTTYPLAGLRFAIKDIIDLAGTLTGGGSREYPRLYNTPKNATAPAIQRLISLGAVPLGKTKSATFAYGAWPDQNEDIPYPWNPRADGYLGLSASSHGSASAIGSYGELDFVLGTDTLGSVRNPADRVGVYGLRPTWGTIEVEGIITSAKTLDSVGFMTRDPLLAHKIRAVWDGENNPALTPGNFSYPKKIIYPTEWFPLNSSVAQDLVDAWLANMTAALGMQLEYQNTSQIFEEVVGYNGTLGDWTTNVSSLTVKDNWDTMGQQFVEDYGAAFGGRYPELDVSVRTSWAQAPSYTQEEYEANVNRSWEFTEFWNEHIIPSNNDTCSEGLWIYHISDTGGGIPEYRDRTMDYFPSSVGAMRGASVAPFAHTVDITIPIGQIAYTSLISKAEEQLAITLNFVAHRGCDRALMEWVRVCAEKGFCKEVKTGRTAY